MSNYDTLNISAYIIEFKGCHWAIFVFKREDPWKVKEITSDIRFMDFKSYMWIKLSQEEKWFAKISSLAQVTDKKTSKIASLAESIFFDVFLAITRAREDIFANHFFSWLNFIHTQLLIPLNPISEVIFGSPLLVND